MHRQNEMNSSLLALSFFVFHARALNVVCSFTQCDDTFSCAPIPHRRPALPLAAPPAMAAPPVRASSDECDADINEADDEEACVDAAEARGCGGA